MQLEGEGKGVGMHKRQVDLTGSTALLLLAQVEKDAAKRVEEAAAASARG
jgi:hypothetical protein